VLDGGGIVSASGFFFGSIAAKLVPLVQDFDFSGPPIAIFSPVDALEPRGRFLFHLADIRVVERVVGNPKVAFAVIETVSILVIDVHVTGNVKNSVM
jgi:hypothetical protein